MNAPERPEQNSITVLVVEDHTALRDLIATVLTDAGYRVMAASNGEEALGIAANIPVDVVLTDVTMPGMTGPALVERLREQSERLHVIFISGHDQGILSVCGYAAHFLRKPFKPAELRSVMLKALEPPAVANASQTT
jgi:two-component system cell cycle sensor histidine kinase/response regulator CckA